jgi:alpha-L-fucosidase
MVVLKKAGVRYAVLTTKHHDDYALWPSEYSDFGTKTHLNERDLVGEYVEACRAHDIKIGFYYSPPDWWFSQNMMSFHYGGAQPDLDIHHQPVNLSAISERDRAKHVLAHCEVIRPNRRTADALRPH